MDRGHGGKPVSILIEYSEAPGPPWKFSIFNESGDCIDYTFSSSLTSLMRMARKSWRTAMKKAKDFGYV